MRIPVIPTSTRLLATKTPADARRATRPGSLLSAMYHFWMLRVPFIPTADEAETMPFLTWVTRV